MTPFRPSALGIAVIFLVLTASCGREGREETVRWDHLVSDTHIGVACAVPPAHAHLVTVHGMKSVMIDEYLAEQCDRIGLAIWLTSPATQLRAWVAGRPVTMHAAPPGSPDIVPTASGTSEYFVGFLQPAGFKNGTIRIDREAMLHISVDQPGGKRASSSYGVQCCGGWG